MTGCQACGGSLPPQKPGRKRKWCSERCRKSQYDLVCHKCGGRCDGTTPSKVADLARPMCASCCVKRSREDIEYRRAKGNVFRGVVRWSDDQILDAIRSVAVDGKASSGEYERRYEDVPRGSMPSMPLIQRRFGLWSTACQRAGLVTLSGRAGAYASRMTQEMCLLALEDCWADVGRAPTYSEYQEWAAITGSPSAEVLRLRFAPMTWMDIIDMAAPNMEAAA